MLSLVVTPVGLSTLLGKQKLAHLAQERAVVDRVLVNLHLRLLLVDALLLADDHLRPTGKQNLGQAPPDRLLLFLQEDCLRLLSNLVSLFSVPVAATLILSLLDGTGVLSVLFLELGDLADEFDGLRFQVLNSGSYGR